jgi:hypothetical protein
MGYGGALAMAQGPSQDDPSDAAAPRFGGYGWVRALVQAPGMILAEGRGELGEQALLQLVPLRPAADPEAAAAREDYVHMLARATALLNEAGEGAPFAHGFAPGPGGAGEAFWVLPWVEGAEAARPEGPAVESADALAGAATALLERLRRRHEAGLLDPLLSPAALVLSGPGRLEVLGLPLHLPADGLDAALPPAPAAPEEVGEPTPKGDLWRAGQALLAVARGVPGVPAGLQAILQRLAAPDPAQRYGAPEQALLELEALDTTLGAPSDLEHLATLALDTDQPSGEASGESLPTAPEDAVDEGEDLDDPDHEPDTSPEFPSPISQERGRSREPDTQPDPDPGEAAKAGPGPAGQDDRDLATVRVPFPKALKRQAEEELARERQGAGPVNAPSPLPEGETQLDLRRPAARPLKGVAFTQTVVDEYRAGGVDRSAEATLQDVPLHQLEGADEFPTMDEVGPRREASAWARARKDVPFDPTRTRSNQPRPPPAASPMGPRGTIVGVRLINDPTGLRASEDLPGMLPPPRMSDGAPRAEGLSEGLELPEGRALGASDSGSELFGPDPVGAGPEAYPPTDDLRLERAERAPPAAGPTARRPAWGEGPEGREGLPEIPVRPTIPNAPLPPLKGPTPAPMSPAPLPSSSGPGLLAAPPPSAPGYGRPTPPALTPALRAPQSAPPAPAAPVAGRRHLIPGALGFFMAGGLAAFALHYLQSTRNAPVVLEGMEPAAPAPHLEYSVSPANEVLLQASPATAVVVGELDGRPMGKTPLRFLVPPSLEAAILVAADGHEPQRVTLPVRGRIRTDLVPLDKGAPCQLTLAMEDPMDLEGVAAEVTPGPKHGIPGAAVVRAKGRHGAWLVRCPRLGGADPHPLSRRPTIRAAKLSIIGPSNATVFVDDKEIGVTPISVEVQTGFRKVTVEKLSASSERTERWIPVLGDTKVRMPKPRGEGEPE